MKFLLTVVLDDGERAVGRGETLAATIKDAEEALRTTLDYRDTKLSNAEKAIRALDIRP